MRIRSQVDNRLLELRLERFGHFQPLVTRRLDIRDVRGDRLLAQHTRVEHGLRRHVIGLVEESVDHGSQFVADHQAMRLPAVKTSMFAGLYPTFASLHAT